MSAPVSFSPDMLAVPIETVGGGRVERFVSKPGWQHLMPHLKWAKPQPVRPLRRLAARFSRARALPPAVDLREAPIHYSELLEERHHHSYGTPWYQGRYDFALLRALGVRPQDATCDFGCGAGRLGVWLIPYLAPGRYYGVDAHLRSLAAFSAYEIPLHDLASFKPRLLHDDTFAFRHFAQAFDVIVDISVSRWLTVEGALAAYDAARAVLAPGGRLIVIRNVSAISRPGVASWPITDGFVSAIGLRVADRGTAPTDRLGDPTRRNEWVTLVAA
jgi:SAM-dependent methyltransferase